MRALLPLLLIATPAVAQPEDAEHRADRLRTEALNREAARQVARRDRGNDGALDDYAAARREYARRMEAWRRRVAACEGGDWSACDTGPR